MRERERKRKGNVGIRKERLEREGGIEDRGACFASRNTVQEKQDLITVKELILGEESCSKREVSYKDYATTPLTAVPSILPGESKVTNTQDTILIK